MLAWKSRPMVGSATFTAVASMETTSRLMQQMARTTLGCTVREDMIM